MEEVLTQKQAGAREGPESVGSVGWEVQGTFLGPYLRTDNQQPMADRDPPIREGSWSQDKIHSRQQVRVKEGEDSDEVGPCTERCQAIGDPSLRAPGWRSLLRRTYTREKGAGHRPWGRARSTSPSCESRKQRE